MIEIYKTDQENRLIQIEESVFMEEGFDPKDCWINLTNPNDKEVALISKISGIEDDVLKTALDDEERSRVETEDDYTLVLVDIPVIEEGAEDYYSYFTIPLASVIKKDLFITVSLKDTAITRDFIRNRVKGFATYKKTRFLFQILNNIASKYLAYLKQIDKASQRIQNELHKSTKNKELIQMLDLENSLVYFSTSLTGNDAVISRLLQNKTNVNNIIKSYPDDTDLLEDVAVDTKQAMEMCTIYRDILSGTMDAYASVISNNLNIVMKILTSITLIISIPTLIASLFGMNTWVPGQGSPWGFFGVLGSSALVSIALSLYLRKKKLL
ncbi:MAG: magnesium transporter CorA family protein [Clostridia bacterium]|nr:magnesium transporter CorA family protein [Clostridia bacterium]MDE7329148.1 magnesium transporter CorA family protein [Clostridia bacterium]